MELELNKNLLAFKNNLLIASVIGPDAQRYLNARLSNDIKNLSIGQQCWAAALTPQGKTELLLNILRLTQEQFILTTSKIDFPEFKQRLERFKVSDRFDLQDLSHTFESFHLFTDAADSSDITQLLPATDLELLAFPLTKIDPEWKVGAIAILKVQNNQSDINKLNAQFVTEDQYNLWRCKNAWPNFPDEINQNYIFTESEFWSAISSNKGCYVGQEVIEKARTRGQLPFRLMAFSCDLNQNNWPETLSELKQAEQRAGEIITKVIDPTNKRAYGFVRVKRELATHEAELTLGSLCLRITNCQAR